MEQFHLLEEASDMKRTKEIGRKSSGKRRRKPVVYLICEGSETEIRYFKKFRSRECNIDIIPIPSQYKSADKLVQKAKATIGFSPYYPDEGDMIWCVFDRDDNTNAMLANVRFRSRYPFGPRQRTVHSLLSNQVLLFQTPFV